MLISRQLACRRQNEKTLNGFENIHRSTKAEKDSLMYVDPGMTLHFLCECLIPSCKLRICFTIDEYKEIHKNRKCYAVNTKHIVLGVNKVIEVNDICSVVTVGRD